MSGQPRKDIAAMRFRVRSAEKEEFEAYDLAWRERFAGMPRPPRTSIFVADFRGAKRIEISAIAVREQGME
jgi:2-iminobutanoate/2-iminopropanoate deaminase